MNLPIIRLEVEGMRRTISAALMEHSAQMDTDIQAAVDAYCTPEHLSKVVQGFASSALDCVIKEEIDNYFRNGDGRKAIRAAVKESILANSTYTILDEAP